jgi:hypothetical protein
MTRLRLGVMAVVLGTGMTGCGFSHFNIAHWSLWHCDECDDFPMPAYGPGYSMVPGTYTNVGPNATGEGNGNLNSTPAAELAPAGRPTTVTPPPVTDAPPATTTPPVPPDAGPGPGAAVRQPANAGLEGPDRVMAGTNSELPPLPPDANDVEVPRAPLPGGTSVR